MTDHSHLIERARFLEAYNGAGVHDYLRENIRELASALSSQSLSLSEAREEIERSEIGRHRLGHALREATRQRDEALATLKASGERETAAIEAGRDLLSYLALYDFKDRDPGEELPEHMARLTAALFARSALENSKARLADATSNPPLSDLSSLRKGAEAPCPHAPTYDAGLCCGHPDDCTFVSPSGLSKWASATEDGIRAKLLRLAKALHAKHYAHVPQWEPFEDAYGLIDQIDNMTAALVSGSREEQS